MEKTKVLLVADTYYPKVDGTLKFLEIFIEKTKKEIKTSLLIPNFKKEKDKQNKTFLKVSKFIKLSNYSSIKFSFSNLRKIKRAIKENEIIFIQGPALASYCAMYYGRYYKKKVVTYIHVVSWELFEKFLPPFISKLFLNLIRKVSIFLYNRCDLVIVPYHDLKDELRCWKVKAPIEVVRLGVDLDRFKPGKDKKKAKKSMNIDPTKIVIGYVGRVSKEKNVHTLAAAFQKLGPRENFQLLIVGDGDKQLVKELKKIKNCKVTGFVKDVEKYLQAMDIFVMPSLTETTSLATLEAMATGLPVIATKVGFIKNYLVKNYNGIFFPRENPSLLKVKIERLLKHPQIMEKIGLNARKTVTQGFSWERSIGKITRVFKEIQENK